MSHALSVVASRFPAAQSPHHPGTLTATVITVQAETGSSGMAPVPPETRDRVRAAIVNSGRPWPADAVGLTAATDVSSSLHDLAAAIAICLHTGVLAAEAGHGVVFAAELGLDGRLRPSAWLDVDAAVRAAAEAGHHTLVTAADTGAVVAPRPGLTVYGAGDLDQVLTWLNGTCTLTMLAPDEDRIAEQVTALGPGVRAAVEVAAAGGHRLGVLGPATPARDLPAHLLRMLIPAVPPSPPAPCVEGTAALVIVEAARASIPALVGAPMSAQIGALERAANGVLVLAGAEAITAPVRDSLHAVLAAGTVSRMGPTGRLSRVPVPVHLVTTLTPCGCHRHGLACVCTTSQLHARATALSWDWPDQVWTRLRPARTLGEQPVTVACSRERVTDAREAALARWGAPNATASGEALLAYPLDTVPELTERLRQGRLRGHAVETALRVAWTLADLAGSPTPTTGHVGRALMLCSPTTDTEATR